MNITTKSLRAVLVAAVLVFAAIVTITSVLRLAYLSRREEMDILFLVSVPPAAIRGPFVVEGVLQTLIATLTAIGLLFAQIGRWSGSIFGITLAHGTSNIMLFLVMPWLAPQLADLLGLILVALMLVGALAFAIVGGILRLQTSPEQPAGPSPRGHIRASRRAQQMRLSDGPAFGGMSGVLYGLFGYAWMKTRFAPELGVTLSPQTVTTLLVWFVLCLSPFLQAVIGPVANVAHAVGLLVGVAAGVAPHLPRLLRRGG